MGHGLLHGRGFFLRIKIVLFGLVKRNAFSIYFTRFLYQGNKTVILQMSCQIILSIIWVLMRKAGS